MSRAAFRQSRSRAYLARRAPDRCDSSSRPAEPRRRGHAGRFFRRRWDTAIDGLGKRIETTTNRHAIDTIGGYTDPSRH